LKLERKIDECFKVYTSTSSEENLTRYQNTQEELEPLRESKIEGGKSKGQVAL
jgi:hypothetical protein